MIIILGLLVDIILMVMMAIVIVKRGVVNKQNKATIKVLIRYTLVVMNHK